MTKPVKIAHCMNCNKDYDQATQGAICPHDVGGRNSLLPDGVAAKSATPAKIEAWVEAKAKVKERPCPWCNSAMQIENKEMFGYAVAHSTNTCWLSIAMNNRPNRWLAIEAWTSIAAHAPQEPPEWEAKEKALEAENVRLREALSEGVKIVAYDMEAFDRPVDESDALFVEKSKAILNTPAAGGKEGV